MLENEKEQQEINLNAEQEQNEEENEQNQGKELLEKLAAKEQELEDLNQRVLRVAADFENFRKRTKKEKEDLIKYGNEKLIINLLPVIDNFQRAIDVKETSEEIKGFLEGMEMIYRQFMQVLADAGLEAIEAVGKPFEPEKHEAVMQAEDNSVEDNTVLEDFRTGYLFKDKVIRASMVKVAKNN